MQSYALMSKRRKKSNSVLIAIGQGLARGFSVIPDNIYELLSRYFRLEIEGEENLPENGKGIVVANHSDALGYDGFMLPYTIEKAIGRKPAIMVHKFWFSNEILNAFSRSFELFPADLKEGLNALAGGKLMIIFPEGSDGNFKVSSNMYRLVEFNPGFVPLAIMQRAPVIPTVVIGAEETHFNLGKTGIFRKYINADVPLPLNIIPFPAKWKIKFLKPIDFSKYNKKDIKDPRFVKEINQNIRYRIQHKIDLEFNKRIVTT